MSLDGIQPDKGNETMYLVRDVLTGRILTAENVTSSTKVMIKQVLAPVVALQLPIIGVISDALESQFNIYLDFFPISRSINDVDISLTNTKDGFPARFGLRQPSKRFQNTRLCWRVS